MKVLIINGSPRENGNTTIKTYGMTETEERVATHFIS